METLEFEKLNAELQKLYRSYDNLGNAYMRTSVMYSINGFLKAVEIVAECNKNFQEVFEALAKVHLDWCNQSEIRN